MAYPTGRQIPAQGAPVFQKLRSLFGRSSDSAAESERPEVAAATQLPPAPPPKVQKGSKSYPGFFKTTKPDPKQPIRRDDDRFRRDFLLDDHGLRWAALLLQRPEPLASIASQLSNICMPSSVTIGRVIACVPLTRSLTCWVEVERNAFQVPG